MGTAACIGSRAACDRLRQALRRFQTCYIGLAEKHSGEETAMAHGRDKPGKEKRKPKKEKISAAKQRPGSEVIEHVQSHGQPSGDKPE